MASTLAPETAATPTAPATGLLGTYKRAPALFVSGCGCELVDDAGKVYIDFCAGIATNALGYADPGLAATITQSLASGLIHLSNLYRNAPGEALANWLVERSFASNVFFSNSGAEANEGAFKFARKWARSFGPVEKCEIISVRGAFHGRLGMTLAATDRAQYRTPFLPLAGGISIAERDLDDLAATMDPDRVAAVIVEPIQGEGGVRPMPREFLEGLRALCTERRVALIFDEIQCGLGRTGHFFAYEWAGVVPDMVTLAKPLAGGLPMGAILVSAPIAATIAPGDHGTTYGGGPLVASAAQYVLGRLSDPAMLAHVREVGAWLGDELRAIGARTGALREVRGTGFMWGIDTHEPAAAVVGRAFSGGLLLVGAGEHTIRVIPPLVADREVLSRGLARLEAALTAG
ncbi:MAG: acetylornithine transaminase [Gemmatimonadaceae bacterium]|jgi:acetylornithine/N-succinyldiaminopimelate aminotransferase|nr:acetylornithine transaminase [Gemmatimonadaceae bacterium]